MTQVYVNVKEQGYTTIAIKSNQRLHECFKQVYVNGLPPVRATQAGRSLRHLGKRAKASQAGRSLRTTLGGISSLALGLSGPPIGGISSWRSGTGRRWHTGAADHQMMEFGRPGLRGGSQILGEFSYLLVYQHSTFGLFLA